MAALQLHSLGIEKVEIVNACSWCAMRYLSRLILSVCINIAQDVVYQPVDWDKQCLIVCNLDELQSLVGARKPYMQRKKSGQHA